MEESEEPKITIEQFYEKTHKLNEVYRNNVDEMNRVFFEKQKALFEKMSLEDQETVRKREQEKMQEIARKVITPGLVDPSGKKITMH